MSLPLPIGRHNINLTAREVGLLAAIAAGRPAPAGGRARFEGAFATLLGVRHVFALESARVALATLLYALGLPRGARVVVPALTFYTLPQVVAAMGFEVVPAPIDPARLCLDPAGLESLLPGAAAVLLIHPFGQVADVAAVRAACQRKGVILIEDPSQSTGAVLDGVRAGAFGLASVFSLVHGKNLQTFGGGLLATDDDALAVRVRARLAPAAEPLEREIRARLCSGLLNWAAATRPGFAAAWGPLLAASEWDRVKLDAAFAEHRPPFDPERAPVLLSDAQGALGELEIAELDERNLRRADNAAVLLEALRGVPGITLPGYDPRAHNTFNAVAVRVLGGARALARRLLRRGIDARDDYMDWLGEPPVGFGELIYLPNHPGLGEGDMLRVAGVVRRLVE